MACHFPRCATIANRRAFALVLRVGTNTRKIAKSHKMEKNLSSAQTFLFTSQDENSINGREIKSGRAGGCTPTRP